MLVVSICFTVLLLVFGAIQVYQSTCACDWQVRVDQGAGGGRGGTTLMLDRAGDAVVLVSTIPSRPFAVDRQLAHKSPGSARAVPPAASPVGQPPAVTDLQLARSPRAVSGGAAGPAPGVERRRGSSPDDCAEITSTVADDPPAALAPQSPTTSACSSPHLDPTQTPTSAAAETQLPAAASQSGGGVRGPAVTTVTTASVHESVQKRKYPALLLFSSIFLRTTRVLVPSVL